MRVRRHQQVAVAASQGETVYVVRSGLLLLQMLAPSKHRQLLSLFYPNDVFCTAFGPPFPAATLVAAAASELWRLPGRSFEAMLGDEPPLCQQLNRQLADQHARSLLHVAMLGTLNGEERFASFLVELGLRLGTSGSSGISFQIPLSRNDIADYLSLNPDTLSRITSRLKARGLMVQTGRGRIVVPNWERLCEQTPIAPSLVALHRTTGKAAAEA